MVIDNVVGVIVSYALKIWYVQFPTLLDENKGCLVKSYDAKKFLEGIENYKNCFGK